VLGRWTHQLGEDSRLTMQAYVDVTRRSQALLEDRRTTFDADVQYDLPTLGPHNIIAGVRYRNTSDDVTQTEVITSANGTHQSELLSAFAQDQIALGADWRLTVGSKFDDNDYTGFEIQPSARLQWMGRGQMAWGSISRAVRSPSELEREFNILFAAGPPIFPLTIPTSLELQPSPNFDSEEVVAYELGYRRQWTPDLAMDVALFHNEYDGLSTLTPIPAQIGTDPDRFIIAPIIITNSTSARTDGVELLLDWQARDDLSVSATYSYLDMELDGPPAPLAVDSEAAEGQSPRNQASLRVRWDATDRFAVDGTVYYVDNLPAYDINAYTRFDLRLALRLNENVQLELVGQNLFDDSHQEFANESGTAEIQRSVFGRLTWRG
jgi:iron complex outermembrane receptor protein